MAFGFFKKKETADLIIRGGSIYTQTADAPWVNAVAVKDGKILAIGDEEDIEDLEDDDTEVIDLEGGFMLPGLIETAADPLAEIFQDSFLEVTPSMDIEDVLGVLSDYAYTNLGSVIFAIGMADDLLSSVEGTSEEKQKMLDEVSDTKPVIVLSETGNSIWLNTVAVNEIMQQAVTDNVRNITVQYALSVFEIIDFEDLEKKVLAYTKKLAETGVTTIATVGGNEFLDGLFQDVIIESAGQGKLRQRLYGRFLMAHNMDPKMVNYKLQKMRTNVVELEWEIINEALNIRLPGFDIDYDSDEETVLDKTVLNVVDNGFDIRIEAETEEQVNAAIWAMQNAYEKGYRKINYTLATELKLNEEDYKDTILDEVIIQVPVNYVQAPDKIRLSGMIEGANVQDAIDKLTINGAVYIGQDDLLGSIEPGKAADFAVYDSNPFDAKIKKELNKLTCVMTILNGEVVYDLEGDNENEQLDMLMNTYF